MSILQVLTSNERKQLSQSDHDYLKRQLAEHTMLSRLLNKPVNQRLLHELQCILDKQPLPRQKTEHIKYPCITRKMTDEEKIKYGVK